MKAITLSTILTLTILIAHAQPFKLKFTTFERCFVEDYTAEMVKSAIESSYSLVERGEAEFVQGDSVWKFRDENKSNETLISIQFDKTSKEIQSIQFTAPYDKVKKLKKELTKNLGFDYIWTEATTDFYQDITKNLGAAISPDYSSTENLWLFQVYRFNRE